MRALQPLFLPPTARDGDLRFAAINWKDIDEAAIVCWRDLFHRSCHQNPFLAPEFVLPAWRWLSPDENHVMFLVESCTDGRWLAAGGFELNQTSQMLPWPHVTTSDSLYTFRTGLLIDAQAAATAVDALLKGIASGGWQRQTVEIPNIRLDSTLARELAASAKRLGYSWRTTVPRLAPAVFPDIVSEEYLASHWSTSRRKSLRRSKAKLETIGSVQLRFRQKLHEVADALETFLRLERDSWKGEAGTACTSNPNDEAFIREMIAGMADQNRLLISELCAGEHVVASAINLVADGALFAFKIGWDGAWAAASPGVLHEAELMLATRDRLRDFTLLDSCASENSYIGPIWPERIPVATGILCTSRWTCWSDRLMETARRWRRWVRRRAKPVAGS